MPRRLTDTEKWKKPFIKSLPAEYKLFWIFLTDDVSHAGIWQVDREVLELRLGIKLSIEKAQGLFKKQVVAFDNGAKWFLPGFILFQYGPVLNPDSKIHKSVIKELEKYNLFGYLEGFVTLKDKDKDKVISKEELLQKIELKKQNFKKTLEPFFAEYGKDLINEFFRYWAEATANSLHLRYELEDTWELKLRLKRWQKNNNKFSK